MTGLSTTGYLKEVAEQLMPIIGARGIDMGLQHGGSRPKLLEHHQQSPFVIHDEWDDVPEDLLCPISLTLMTDPIVAVDGHTYQRKSFLTYVDRVRMSK